MAEETVQRPRVVYVVLTHHKSDEAIRLVHAILRSSPDAQIMVYHDARRSAPPAIDHQRVEVLTHTHPTDWGSWEIVTTTMEAFSHVHKTYSPDLVVLVSGQDYPAGPLREWERQMMQVGGWVGTSWPLEYRPRWGKAYGEGNDEWTRYAYRWLRLPGAAMIRDSTTRPAAWLRWALSRVGHYLEPLIAVRVVSRGRGYHLGLRRCIRKRQKFYRGSQWVALDRPSLEHLLHQFTENHQLNRIFKRSIIPDESYVQTIMTRQYPPASGPLTYVEWVVEEDAPRTLTMQDLPEVLAQGSPFCRKVEIGVSDELMDELDRRSAISA